MIHVTDTNRRVQLIAPSAIARLIEAGISSKWHGINTYIHLFDGTVVEAAETLVDIESQLAGGE